MTCHGLLHQVLHSDPAELVQECERLKVDERDKLLERLLFLLKQCDKERAITVANTRSTGESPMTTLPVEPSYQQHPEQTSQVSQQQRDCVQSSTTTSAENLSAAVLESVCISQFLTVRDMGRLLLWTSKSINQSLGDERIWELLCLAQWKNTKLFPMEIFLYRGYQWFFRKRWEGLQQLNQGCQHYSKTTWKIPELSLQRLSLLISIFNEKQEEVVSLSLDGQKLQSYLENGELNIPLHDPVPLGMFPIKEDGLIAFDKVNSDFTTWRATMHLLRTDTCQCALVHRSSQGTWGEYDYYEDARVGVKEEASQDDQLLDLGPLKPRNAVDSQVKPPPVEVDMGYLEFSDTSEPPGLQFSTPGKVLFQRVRQYEQDQYNDRLQTIKMEPTLLCFTHNFDEGKKTVDLAFSELRLDIWKSYESGSAMLFHSGYESNKHQVTLLHLLEHLAISWGEIPS